MTDQPQHTETTELPILSVIIVNWNTRDLTAACLESVAAEIPRLHRWFVEDQQRVAQIETIVQTIVVDNASHDGSVAALRAQFPWIQLVENPNNIGFAAANNQALADCRGDYVLLLNSDTVVLPGAFVELVAYLEAHPTVGAAGSRYFNPDGTLQPSCYPAPTVSRELWRLFHLDKLYPYGIYRSDQWADDQPRQVDIVQGASLMIRRAIATELGLFDTDYFMYTEEVDLCRRIRLAGWQIVWVPQSTIIHYGGQSTQQVAQAMFLQLYRSKILYFRKHHGRIATLLYKGVLMLATLARLLLTPLAWVQKPTRRQASLMLANHYRSLAAALPSM